LPRSHAGLCPQRKAPIGLGLDGDADSLASWDKEAPASRRNQFSPSPFITEEEPEGGLVPSCEPMTDQPSGRCWSGARCGREGLRDAGRFKYIGEPWSRKRSSWRRGNPAAERQGPCAREGRHPACLIMDGTSRNRAQVAGENSQGARKANRRILHRPNQVSIPPDKKEGAAQEARWARMRHRGYLQG